jgi:hypothetical protein
MARNVGGTYSLPSGSLVTDGVDDILATQHNTPLQDIADDLNIARPIVAGGTGATSAAAALTNLGLTAAGTSMVTAADAAAQATLLGFSKTLGTTQVQVLPGGAIIQCGQATTGLTGVTVTFPTAFTTTPKVVLGVNTAAGANMATCQSVSAPSMVVQAWTFGGTQTNMGVFWIAMGY